MCEPISATTAAYIAIGTTVASIGAQMYGQKVAGDAAEDQANYQASVDRNNQIISGWQADDALARGAEEERRTRLRTAQTIGSQRVSFAANNVDLGSDNVIDTQADTAMFGELDALTVRSNAEREAYQYKVQGMNYGAGAAASTLAGKNAQNAAKIGMGTSLLSGAASVSDRWSTYKKKGVL